MTPPEMRCGPLGFGGSTLIFGPPVPPAMPPRIPPGAPPAIPLIPATPPDDGGGGASSLIILMSLGIFVGACRPWSISDTILIGFTAAGGGGGGADSDAASELCGNASG